ncbi:hypothetical protein LMH87_005517 [Akanthomyces muscarius]|uniref:Uncharacterized protein n=1 Tax=Akanthomyces muscarius TaxID=2231603 RepID=A0A9W8QP02_AKAMU|nr:hypothetical protein LMH87_005517 [Akanthomyces muscarius]KAJ4163812.1 hypothetical protein LMH87_005517 [Akanthomyces muscarius]
MSSTEIAPIARYKATAAKIRAVEDGPVNFLTGKKWSAKHRKLLENRRKLPVYVNLDKILETYHGNAYLVLTSDTGSGKSTQVPQLILQDEFASGLRVVCTQPRRIAATSLARRVSEEADVVLGKEVGYKVGGDTASSENTRIEYVTEGVLLAELMHDEALSKIGVVIIDEAHERTVELDVLLALLKKIKRARDTDDLQTIVMSATLNAGTFQKFYQNCPAVHIPGRSFNVDVKYLRSGSETPSVIISAAQTVVYIHEKLPPGHILVFAPGQSEILKIIEYLRVNTRKMEMRALYSKLAGSQQQIVLDPKGPRQCIVATNIAEASLTIDGIVYVVDTGIAKQQVYNPRLGMYDLRVESISQASANQRKGRAGRTQDGICFRLYTKAGFEDMSPSTQPKILTQPIDSAILKLTSAGYNKVVDFDWLTRPCPESFSRAAQNLLDWGFLGPDNKVNNHLALLTAWDYFMRVREMLAGNKAYMLRQWCEDHFLDMDVLERIVMSRWRLVKQLRSDQHFKWPNLNLRLTTSQFPRVLKALATAFCTNLAVVRRREDIYLTVYAGVEAMVEPHSAAIQSHSEWVVYNTLQRAGGRVLLEVVSPVSAEWLVDLPYFAPGRAAKTYDGTGLRFPHIQESIDRAKARLSAAAGSKSAKSEN